MKHVARASLLSLSIALAASSATAQSVWYVKPNSTPGGDGLSWTTAFRSVRSALDASASGDQIWVAAGTYSPRGSGSPTDPRTAEFFVAPDTQLYGGFAGNETSLAQRAGLFSSTILTGDIGVPGDPSDNCYHVVRTWGAATIDGFTIVDGNAEGYSTGGGIFCDIGSLGGQPPLFQGSGLKLRNCTVARNRAQRGGAIFGMLANLRCALCTFEDNSSTGIGGAISLQTSSARIDLCTFRRNHSGSNGGAIHLASIGTNSTGRPYVQFYGCLFHDNDAITGGGAVYLGGSQFSSGNGAFTSCTFALNQAGAQGGGLFAVTTSPVKARCYLENTIVYANRAPIDPDLTGHHWVWSSIAPGQTGTAVLSAAPHFVSLAQHDFRLQPSSLAIDAGSDALMLPDALDVNGNGSLFEFVPIDLAGNYRPFGAHIDMGAFEQ
jgi:predicted outer membrane repeat protein